VEDGSKQIESIPKDWEIVILGDESIADLIMGQSPPSSTYNDKGIGLPFLQGNAEFGETYPKSIFSCSQPIKIAEKNDILLSVRAPVGDINITHSKSCIGRGLAAIRPKNDKLNYLFLFYYLKFGSRIFESLSMGSTFKAIRKQEVEKFQIPLPPLPEQRRIAEILGTVDTAIQKVGGAIESTERLKKGLMQRLLTRGIVMGFMLDTNIFNHILNENMQINLPPEFNYYITHIQFDELNSTRIEERKSKLLKIFKEIDKEEILTESATVGISRVGKSKISDNELFEKLLFELQKLDKENGKKKRWENQKRDILIAETCIKNNLILITNDKNLRTLTIEYNGQAVNLEQFLKGDYKEFKDSEIGKIPEIWKVVRLGDISRIKYGLGQPPQTKNDGVPMIRATNINSGKIFEKDVLKIDITKIPTTREVFLKEGDIIVVNSGAYTGDIGLVTKKWEGSVAGYDLIVSSNRDKVEPRFLSNYLLSPQIQKICFMGLKTRSAQSHLNSNQLENISVALPPLPEQGRIAEILNAVDRKLELERRRKEKLERVKKGLMNELLTGRKRVKI